MKSIATTKVAENWWSGREHTLIRSSCVVAGVDIHQIGSGGRWFADGQPEERLTHGYWAEAAAGPLEAVVLGAATERATLHASAVRFATNPVRLAHCAADGRGEDERHRYDDCEGGHSSTHEGHYTARVILPRELYRARQTPPWLYGYSIALRLISRCCYVGEDRGAQRR